MENKAFKVAGIKNLMKRNYAVPPDLINVEDEVDNSISMAENWYVIKGKILLISPKVFIWN